MKVRITKISKMFDCHVSDFAIGSSLEGELIEPLRVGNMVVLKTEESKGIIVCNKIDAIVDKNHFNSPFSRFKIEYLN